MSCIHSSCEVMEAARARVFCALSDGQSVCNHQPYVEVASGRIEEEERRRGRGKNQSGPETGHEAGSRVLAAAGQLYV